MKINIDVMAYVSNLISPAREWVIPEKHYMVMGDNRNDSEDSREWGLVPLGQIHGKVFMSYFSVNWGYKFDDERVDDSPFSKNPLVNLIQFLTGKYSNAYVRWSRFGMRIF